MNRSQKLDQLVGNVEELLERLPRNPTPEITAWRDKVDAAIFDAWTCIAGERTMPRMLAQPCIAIAFSCGLAAAIGFLVGAARGRARPPL
jgi:ElaB/YqjD/DUF883 family membrane-anchored ribosome-binding protein